MVVAMKRACWAMERLITEHEKAPFQLGLALRHKLPMSSPRGGCWRDDVNNSVNAVDAVDMIGSSDADTVGGSINPSNTATSLTRHDGSLCPWHVASGSSSRPNRSRLIRTVTASLWSGLASSRRPSLSTFPMELLA